MCQVDTYVFLALFIRFANIGFMHTEPTEVKQSRTKLWQ